MKPNLTMLMAAAIAAAIGVAGCNKDVPTPTATTITTLHDDAERHGWSDQERLLADGDATRDDLNTAYENYKTCIEDLGFSLKGPTVNRVDGWRLLSEVSYNSVTDARTQERAGDCSASHMSLIEVGYEITHPAKMDQPLMGAVRSCLGRHGISTRGTEQNVDDLAAGDKTRMDAIQTCVQSAAHQLYPREPITLAY